MLTSQVVTVEVCRSLGRLLFLVALKDEKPGPKVLRTWRLSSRAATHWALAVVDGSPKALYWLKYIPLLAVLVPD